jgi:hypothetical protein
MSQSGALIEASNVPEPGATVILKRGGLEIPGHLAWSIEPKAGIAFSAAADVSRWMSRQASAHQQRVDDVISAFKSDLQPRGAPNASTKGTDTPLLAELSALQVELTELGNGLANDAILVANHPEIQLIDIALQRVKRSIEQLQNA